MIVIVLLGGRWHCWGWHRSAWFLILGVWSCAYRLVAKGNGGSRKTEGEDRYPRVFSYLLDDGVCVCVCIIFLSFFSRALLTEFPGGGASYLLLWSSAFSCSELGHFHLFKRTVLSCVVGVSVQGDKR